MPSNTLTDRQKSVAEVLSVIRTQSQEAAAGLDAFFAPDAGEGEARPDFAVLTGTRVQGDVRRPSLTPAPSAGDSHEA